MSDTCDSFVGAAQSNLLKSLESTTAKKPNGSSTKKQFDRTNSFDKFVTTYNIICAQNILFLPNVLNWLKTSILQNYIEKLIYSIKSLAFKCSLYVAVLLRVEFEANAHDVQWSKLFERVTRCFIYVRQQKITPKRKVSTQPIEQLTIEQRNRQLRALFERDIITPKPQQSKFIHLAMIILIYFSVCFVYIEMIALLYALALCPNIPWGMAFLLIAGLSIVTLGFLLMKNPVVKKKSKPTQSQRQHNTTRQHSTATNTTSIATKKFDFTEKTISKIHLF